MKVDVGIVKLLEAAMAALSAMAATSAEEGEALCKIYSLPPRPALLYGGLKSGGGRPGGTQWLSLCLWRLGRRRMELVITRL